MRKTWTITVDIQEGAGAYSEGIEEEMEYWDDYIERCLSNVLRNYQTQIDMSADRLEYQPIDYTNISVHRQEEL